MRSRPYSAPVWVIWGLVGVFGVIEAVAWASAGGVPRRPVVLIQVLSAWTVMIVPWLTPVAFSFVDGRRTNRRPRT